MPHKRATDTAFEEALRPPARQAGVPFDVPPPGDQWVPEKPGLGEILAAIASWAGNALPFRGGVRLPPGGPPPLTGGGATPGRTPMPSAGPPLPVRPAQSYSPAHPPMGVGEQVARSAGSMDPLAQWQTGERLGRIEALAEQMTPSLGSAPMAKGPRRAIDAFSPRGREPEPAMPPTRLRAAPPATSGKAERIDPATGERTPLGRVTGETRKATPLTATERQTITDIDTLKAPSEAPAAPRMADRPMDPWLQRSTVDPRLTVEDEMLAREHGIAPEAMWAWWNQGGPSRP